jgi:acetoacetyl-CoA synthetase
MTSHGIDALWRPSPARVESAEPTRYMRWLRSDRGLDFQDYNTLWEWSVTRIEDFWTSIWDFFEVRSRTRAERVLTSRKMPGPNGSQARRSTGASTCFGQGELTR